MQLKVVKFLLKILKLRPKLQHLVILFAPLVILFRFDHLVNFPEVSMGNFQESSISIGKTAHAESPAPVMNTAQSEITKNDAAQPDKKFDPLTLDENQVKVLQAMAEAKSQKPTDGEIEKQKKIIEIGKEKIAEQLATLEKAKADLEKKKVILTKEETKNLTQTAKIYENMKPISAAEIFNKMDLTVLAQIIKHMNQKRAAAIIAVMEPKKARYLTIELLRADQIELASPQPVVPATTAAAPTT